MYYSKRDKMIMITLFAYNINYVFILLSFLRHLAQFRGHVVCGYVPENRHRKSQGLCMYMRMSTLHGVPHDMCTCTSVVV